MGGYAMKHDAIRRFDAASATLAKYRGKPFDWAKGLTCLHMVRSHLVKLGYRPETLPRIKSAVAARRALDARGWATTADMIDAQGFQRIAPAMMVQGDIAYRSSEDGFGGLLVCVGPLKMMGWFENAPDFVVMDMQFDQLEAAWRV